MAAETSRLNEFAFLFSNFVSFIPFHGKWGPEFGQLSSRVVTARKCTKKRDARAKDKVAVLLIKAIAFLN